MDLNWMHEAYRRVNPKASPGVDGQTWQAYGEHLTDNLKDLLNRAKSGSYKAPPLKRSYVPKNEKEKRPIGLPTIENKILERAVAMILEPVYEEEFYDFSYGFRPGRSAHQALEYLRKQCLEQKVEWILEVDLRKFFDTVDHRQMQDLLSHRVQDGVITRLVGKWLKAGVWEKGQVSYPENGTPQGGVISPLLSNIYLHEVLDKWFVETVKPRCGGNSFMVRFADDFVMGFQRREDMEKVLKVIAKRFAKYGLKVNEEKTRKVRFKRPLRYGKDPLGKPGTFDFLGFTIYWSKTRRGINIPKVKTANKRFTRALNELKQWGWSNRHLRLREQWQKLNEKLRGHDAYYGVRHNFYMLQLLRWELQKHWRKWLNRRNRRGGMSWEKFNQLMKVYPLVAARIVHSVT
jgi:group II intron reverse transcriptase/maturase